MVKNTAFFAELISSIKKDKLSKQKLSNHKMLLCKKHNIKSVPTDIEILMQATEADVKKIRKYLQTKPTRTGSGVAVVAVMTKPHDCPHGKCAMCPGGPESFFGSVPQSYTGNEPASLRAIRNNYDPYLQVFNRLEQYVVLGQNPEKVELIIMGGTFPALPDSYKQEFVRLCFKAMNDFSRKFWKNQEFSIMDFKRFFLLPGNVGSDKRTQEIHKKTLFLKSQGKKSIQREQLINEKTSIRCVGLTIETRPDWGYKEHGNELLKLGCTRVELGIQSVHEKALKKIERGHSVEDSVKSIQELKDLGFKLNFHIMPGIEKKKKDIQGLKEVFEDSRFRPDMLKIYPLMVMPGTKLYTHWKKKMFKPINTKEAAKRIIELKKVVPAYCRIMRVQRDIPSKLAEAGVDRTNLRQYIQTIMKKKNIVCNCIRCNEIKHIPISDVNLHKIHYMASKGNEFFIFLESSDKIVGFCRMRFPYEFLRKEITRETALIRELHVYSSAVGLGKQTKGTAQHKGYGTALLAEAESIAKTYYRTKIVVISGIGVREYYKKRGYNKQGHYMVKYLNRKTKKTKIVRKKRLIKKNKKYPKSISLA
ncbi:MAG: tRNA uridine(34) 5-carboxymethylaminomethyl modification radical SAM/GNAT enzyme Elp3 [Nanoarchaeota archaeon]|nr:tRNA uridine(34) 5-carboxymethylaminomethyl modification radical SAM/GNAT enzyme Elp3 [Nanoarchaeota archaeon]